MAASIKGMAELRRSLRELKVSAQGSAMRNAASFAVTPVAKRTAATVPQGTVQHKTYKGRTVAPGFASRQVRKQVVVSRDKMTVYAMVGFSREAFYTMYFSPYSKRDQTKDDFQEAALRDQQDLVVNRFASQLAKAIRKAAAKK